MTIGGVPFLAHLVSGNFPSVTVEGQQVDSGELTLKSVHAVLQDVHVPVMALARGHRVHVTADSGHGHGRHHRGRDHARAPEAGTGVTVEFDDGRVRVQVPGIPAFVERPPRRSSPASWCCGPSALAVARS